MRKRFFWSIDCNCTQGCYSRKKAQIRSILTSTTPTQQTACHKCTCFSLFSSGIILIQICKILTDLRLRYLETTSLTIVFQRSCINWANSYLSSSCIIWFSAAHFNLSSRINISPIYQNLRHNFSDLLPNKLN